MRRCLRLTLLTAFAAICLTVRCGAQVCPQLWLNGAPAFCDSASSRHLATIGEECFGGSLEATVTAPDGWRVAAVDGTAPGSDGRYLFRDISGSASWGVTAVSQTGDTARMTLQFTFLPIVQITGETGYDYSAATMTLAAPGAPAEEAMAARIKWRGGTTNVAGKHKRNYSVKFVDAGGAKLNRRLLGLRRDNHWILDAGQVDLSRVRNRVATDLWLDMAAEPYYINQAPEALSGARGRMVEVFLNNDYAGIYNLCEAVDRKQLQLAKHDEATGTFHGGLWKTDTYNNHTCFRQSGTFLDTSEACCGFEVKYPDFEEVNPTDWQVLSDAVTAMADYISPGQFNEIADDYFDMPVMIDYAIFLMALKADDNTAKNVYWACHDRQKDRRLTPAVWDLDVTVGQTWNNNGRQDPAAFTRPQQWALRMLCNPCNKYRSRVLWRHRELRRSWLSEESLTARYTAAINRLIASGAAAREAGRWSGDSDIRGLELDFESEKQFIEQWIKARMPLLDRFVGRCLGDVNHDGTVNAADVTALYNAILNGDTTQDIVETYDINLDNAVNAADITALYNAILNY